MDRLDLLYHQSNYSDYIYMDNCATTRVDPLVANDVLEYFAKSYGNCSSVHTMGKIAQNAVDKARKQVADLLNCTVDNIYFTSGCSESNNWVLNGVLSKCKVDKPHIITTKIEHNSILNTCKHLEKENKCSVTYLDVDKDGFVDLDQLNSSITKDTVLISIMYANNEVGTVQNIKYVSEIANKHNILLHTDATQAVGKLEIDLSDEKIDFLSFSGHKIHAPKGVGVLYIKDKEMISPFIFGGEQQNGLRAGTENVPGIVGLGKACEIIKINQVLDVKHMKELQIYMFKKLENIPDIIFTGSMIDRLPNIISICVKNLSGNAVVLALDTCNIGCSSGSACNMKKLSHSYVLEAMGIDDDYINGSLRFSLSKYSTKFEIDYVVSRLKTVIETIKAL